MKKNIKKQIIGGLTALSIVAMLSSGCVMAKNSSADNADAIKVTYNGEAITFDVQPEIVDDRVLVPMRAIFETLGAKVKWDGDSQTITSKKKSKTISMTIGSTDMTKNDETYTFDVSPIIEDGRTLVPLRAISELLGLDVEWDEDTRTVTIESSEDDDAWKSNTGTIELGTMSVTGEGISVSDNVITITAGGDFEVTGVSDNGQIVIDTEDKVKLRLSGMSLTNPTGSAIYVKNADKAYITLTENTDNTLTDGETYTSGDENEKGTITSRDNLEIKGKGSLTINASYNNGIDASDSLDIENGNITITSKNDGISVNDTLTVSGGTIDITAEGDGMQAGDIVDITGGTVNITTTGEVASSSNQFGFGGRGMQQTTATDDTSDDVSSKGIKADWLVDISGGTVNLTTTDHAIHCTSDIEISGGDITIASDNKGVSAHEDLTINGGSIDITKSSEGLEAKAIMTLNDGDIKIVASDDGLNAGGGDTFGGGMGGGAPMGGMSFGGQQDGQTEASADGTQQQNMGMRGGRGMRGGMQQGQQDGMTPPEMNGEMPQGMQQMTPPEMNGDMQQGGRGMRGGMNGQQGGMTPPEMNGEMPSDMRQGGMMTPPDMQSGDESSTQQNRGGFGGGMMGHNDTGEIDTEHHIQINGGTLYIECQGDGIDSNGTIQINGGTVTVNSPATGSETSFDAEGSIIFNGGTIVGIGCSGTGETPGSHSTQNVIIAYTTSSFRVGDKITVKDSNGNTVFETTSAKGGSMVTVSTPDIKTGETYTITVGDETLTADVTDTITSVGTKQQSMGGGRGGMGGQRGIQDIQSAEQSGAQS